MISALIATASKISFLKNYWFQLSLLLIAAVSLYDTYLIYYFESEIVSMEENPIGCWLLEIGDGEIGIFVRTKLAGTVCVITTLVAMWLYRSRMVFPVTTSVASYQVGLFMYLTVV